MSPVQFSSLRALALLGAAGAVACGDTHATAPTDANSPSASLSLTAYDSAAFAGALNDLHLRIEPALGDAPSVRTLAAAVGRVGAALAARDRGALESALAESDAALAALDQPAPPAASTAPSAFAAQDVDAVRLVLVQARAVLAPPAGVDSAVAARSAQSTSVIKLIKQ